jgi:DNA modification methylase
MEIKSKQIELVAIEKIIPNPKNPNKHPQEQIDRLAKIIDFQGFRVPLIVSNRSGFLVSGHGRLDCAKSLGVKELPVMYQDFESEAQEYAFVVSDNEIQKWAATDLAMVNLEMLDLGPDFDIDLLAIKDFVIEPAEKFEPQGDEDEVPEVVHPITRRGDIWLLGNHRVMNGDSTLIDDVEKLMNGEKADMVFTDPPYGISYKSNWSKKFDEIKGDSEFLDFKPILEIVCEENSPMYIWTSHQVFHIWRELFIENYKSTIIWYKKFGGMGDLKAEYGHNYEMCLYLCNGRTEFSGDRPKAVWEVGPDRPDKYRHPTQKPVELAEYAISHHDKKFVLDLFLGSGSTLIACEKTNRKCYGMELDPKYCDTIIKRFEQYSGKKATLELTGQTYEELKAERDLTQPQKQN